MLTIEKTVLPDSEQWGIVIEGMRNPMNSWGLSDTIFGEEFAILGDKDHKLMASLNKGGTEHSKYRRMLPVWVTVNAPLYWWKEADTYTVGKTQNSCSTMHKIHEKPFTMDDFSCDHLEDIFLHGLRDVVCLLNNARKMYLMAKEDKEPLVSAKDYWWQMIQLLPSSYNQKRTLMVNYEVLAKMYRERKNHKLDEWHIFCDWIKTLPYSELITMEE